MCSLYNIQVFKDMCCISAKRNNVHSFCIFNILMALHIQTYVVIAGGRRWWRWKKAWGGKMVMGKIKQRIPKTKNYYFNEKKTDNYDHLVNDIFS